MQRNPAQTESAPEPLATRNRRPRPARRPLPLVGLLLLFLVRPDSGVGADSADEYQIKAALLYNFAKFVEWPSGSFSGPEDPIVIGVLGKDPFGPILDGTLAGKTIDARKLAIRRFSRLEDVKGVHILFVSSSEEDELAPIARKALDLKCLTVGDSKDFARKGGIVGLKNEEGKVRFEIHVDRARKAGLGFSSKLLKLATVIEEPCEPDGAGAEGKDEEKAKEP